MQDIYPWLVTYEDGTTTAEYDAVRTDGRGWAEIETKPITSLALVALDGRVAHVVHLNPTFEAPVFFRRRQIALDGSGNEQGRVTTHCIGWKSTVPFEQSAVYLFVFPDGTTLLTDDLQAV